MAYEHAKIKVRKGITLIEGINHHYATASSNASGKSSLEEMIAYPAFGRTIRGLAKNKVIRRGAKWAKVWSEYTRDDGKILRLERYRKHPKYGNDARILLDGDDSLTGRHFKETNLEIVRQLGYDFELFKRAVIIHSRVTEGYSSVNDRYLKKITEKLLDMPKFDRLMKLIKISSSKLENSRDLLHEKIRSTEESIEERRALIKSYKNKLKKFNEDTKDQRHDLKKSIATLENSIAKCKERHVYLLVEIRMLDKTCEELQEKIKKKESIVSKAERKLRNTEDGIKEIHFQLDSCDRLEKKLNSVSALRSCPECGQQVSVSHIKKKLHEVKSDMSRWKEGLEEARAIAKTYDKRLDKAKDALSLIVEKISNMSSRSKDLKRDMKALDSEAQTAADMIIVYSKKLGGDLKNPYKALIKTSKKYIIEKKQILESLKSKSARKSKRILYYDFWKRGFGPNGIRSYVLEAVTPILNTLANVYLDVLSDSNVTVNMNTVTPKKDGTFADRFRIEIENVSGSDELKGSSDGELATIDLALNFAMSDVLESRINGGFGFMIVDQAIDLVDLVRGRKAVRLLNNKLDTRWCKENSVTPKKSIWLITHRSELKGMIDEVITVEKRNGISRVT